MVYMADTVPIRVKRDTRQKLTGIGKKGETYDDIINRLFVCYAQVQTKDDNDTLTYLERKLMKNPRIK